MTIVQLPPSAVSLAEAKPLINANFGETELRLQDLEVLSFMRDGAGNPQNSQFNNGDYYINYTNFSLWKKENGVWTSKTSLAGNPGPAGPAGSPGLNHRGLWASATAYNINDAVRYRGSYWRAVRFIGDAVEPTTANTTAWALVARGLNNVRSWVANNTNNPYRVDDMVRYDGEWYIVLTNHVSGATTPNNDTTNYSRVVSKGDVGPQGPAGIQGPQGNPGIQGPIGAGLVNKGGWSSVTAYVTNDAVSYRGAFWAARVNNSNVEPTFTNSATWQQLTRGLNPMAANWSANTPYKRDDLVPHTDGSTYLVLNDHSNSSNPPNLDTTNFRVFAARGLQGPQGNQGIQGPQGDIGPTPTTYEWYKFYRGGLGITGPLTGGGWDRVTTPRTITAMYVRVDAWSATTAPLVVRLVGSQNGGADVNIGQVTLDNSTAQKRGSATNLSQQVDDSWDLRIDVVSGGAVNNLSVIARGQ